MCHCVDCLDIMYILRAYDTHEEESLISLMRAPCIPLQHLIPLLIKLFWEIP